MCSLTLLLSRTFGGTTAQYGSGRERERMRKWLRDEAREVSSSLITEGLCEELAFMLQTSSGGLLKALKQENT